MEKTIKVKSGRFLKALTLIYEGDRVFCKFPYDKKLIDEIRCMQGARYHGFDDENPRKIWSIANNRRNHFQLDYMQCLNPYARYELDIAKAVTDLKDILKDTYPLRDYQWEMAAHWLVHKQCIYGCEMGTGKTLAALAVVHALMILDSSYEESDIWYVGPKAGVRAFNLELIKWNFPIIPGKIITYEALTKTVANWKSGDAAPRIIIFDESSKIKTPTAQRSVAALHVAESMRDEYGDNAYIVEMSGTPAPKTPVDWWMQCEVACPGFLREGDIHKFKARLCLIQEKQSITGGIYPHIVTWYDDSNKCKVCGTHRDAHTQDFDHMFLESINEVEYLYKRMSGLVLVKFKKDCLELPDKQYEEIQVRPTVEILRACKIIQAKSSRAIQALTLIREISDGFQYFEKETGEETCTECFGKGVVTAPTPNSDVETMGTTDAQLEIGFHDEDGLCPKCGGSGTTKTYTRDISETKSPKDEIFIDYLDEYEDVGRFTVWGGFTGTLDRLEVIAHRYGWATLRVDGRGYIAQHANGGSADDNQFLQAMDLSSKSYKELLEKYPKICFIGNPKAGGMALTLTASPIELFYSNVFDGEARMQAEDRGHRLGMDTNRGLRIIDLIMLPTDKLVLDNLKAKKKLQNMSMGELERVMKS